jgi:hypothetical protein
MNLVLSSKMQLVSAVLAAAMILLSLALPFGAALFLAYATVGVLVAMARLDYSSPRSYRDGK